MATEQPLLAIVGPTASGKTALALEVAERYNGEIICADSRTVFQEMDIGTAKPTVEEQSRVQHWGIDLTAPGERFTAAEFQDYANKKVAEIRARGKLPIIAGGTGLYVDGVIFDYDFPQEAPQKVQDFLATLSTDKLYKYCIDNNIQLPENDKNRRHLIRRIVHKDVENSSRNQPLDNTFIVGITTKFDTLRHRIKHRTEHMFEQGVAEEANILGKKYGWDSEAMTANIYPLMKQLLNGEANEADVKSAFITRDYQLAKRQMTWFRRNPYIMWTTSGEAFDYVSKLISDA